MMSYAMWALVVVVLAAGFAFLFDFVRRYQTRQQLQSNEEAAQRMLKEARAEAETIRKEADIKAKELVLQAKADAEKESRERRRDM